MSLELKENTLSVSVTDFFKKAEKDGLEHREGQLEMAQEVTNALTGKYPIAVEAGVGIGKSYAYLVPLVLNFFRERRQVIIATSTIALQEQLERDIHSVMKMLGVKAEVIVATGMKNYVCRRRLESRLRHSPNDKALCYIRDNVSDGRMRQKQMNSKVSVNAWNKVCISSFGERCSGCGFINGCQYHRMRNRLKTENCFVICNHNMLVAHLMSLDSSRGGIFSINFRTIVIDEAHNIEQRFRDAYTRSLSRQQITGELKKASKLLRNRTLTDETADLVNLAFRCLKEDVKYQSRQAGSEMQTFYFNETDNIKALLFKIRRNMAEIEKKTGIKMYSLEFLRGLHDPYSKHLVWIDNSEVMKICCCKKDIRSDISRMLFVNGRSTVLTSATLTSGVEDGYEYFLSSIGYPNIGKVADPKPSPYDYDNNTMLYTTSALTFPRIDKRKEYRKNSISEIVKLLEVTQGKTLILFTSKEDMEYVFRCLSNMKLPYKIIMQDEGSSQEYLLNKFKRSKNSVLLGTGTFWEGINIEGEALSQVIIFKLPFPVPDPMTDYKMSLVNNPIAEVAVPEMIIKLKQGAGRLIRSASDKGIVSILDPRVSIASSASYKDKALDALPEKNRTESIEVLSEFWKKQGEK